MSQLKADDADDDQEDREQSNDVVGVSKKEDAADHRASSADSGPHSISGSDRDTLHGLRDGEEA